MKNVANKFRKLREEKGFTQLQVADDMRVSISTISRLESNPSQLRFEYIIRLAEYYQIPLRKLFSEYEKDNNYLYSEMRIQINLPISFYNSKLFFELARRLKKEEEEKNLINNSEWK